MQTCDEGEEGDWGIMIRLELSFYVLVSSEIVPTVVATWGITRRGAVLGISVEIESRDVSFLAMILER